MQRSNTYIIVFSAILTVVLGGALALAAVGLAPAQKVQVELDTKSQILGAVMSIQKGEDDVIGIYNERIEGLVVDHQGNVVTEDADGNPIAADKVDVAQQFKKAPENRLFPVFKLKGEDGSGVQNYILPVYGNGLWDKIWGFVALEGDLQTIEGVVFDHKAETPGLGARISDKIFQERFKGKRVYDDNGEFVSVTVVKGETNNPDDYDVYTVDGLSGATITAKGVENMIEKYLIYYGPYLAKVGEGEPVQEVQASEEATRERVVVGHSDTTSADVLLNESEELKTDN